MKSKFIEIAGLIPKFDYESIQEITPEMFRFFFDKKKFPTITYLLGFQEDKKFYTPEDLDTASSRTLVALSILLYQGIIDKTVLLKTLNLDADRTIDLINIDCEDHFLTYPLISKVIKKFNINPIFIFDHYLTKHDSIFLN